MPRRVIDLRPLNKVTKKQSHHVESPFVQASKMPANTWKTVSDAWNGFHSVPLDPESRHLTTFITPWGRFWYLVAPKGQEVSGDAYSVRYDDVLVNYERKTKCVDDCASWDFDVKSQIFRIHSFFTLCGENGVIQNPGKFQSTVEK